MRKSIPIFLSVLMLFGSMQSAFAVSADDLSDSQRKLYDRAYAKISPNLSKRTSAYRNNLAKALERKAAFLKNTDQKIVLKALANAISVPKNTDVPALNLVTPDPNAEYIGRMARKFSEQFEKVNFLKFTVSEYENPEYSVKRTYVDEVLFLSAVGFSHNSS